ncbi:MAG: MogA/MoaB family molybdenum cofactor biosynthesis protein [Candidatus Hermodarchaeia archaeon]
MRTQSVKVVCALIITTNTRTEETDESGRMAKRLLLDAGHEVAIHEFVANDKARIQGLLFRLMRNPMIQVIITSGGTGISVQDVTVEAVSDLLEKRIDGFGELFRQLSYDEMGEAAMLSRALAGTVRKKIIFCLPGSKTAMELGLKRLILPGLGHMLWELNR